MVSNTLQFPDPEFPCNRTTFRSVTQLLGLLRALVLLEGLCKSLVDPELLEHKGRPNEDCGGDREAIHDIVELIKREGQAMVLVRERACTKVQPDFWRAVSDGIADTSVARTGEVAQSWTNTMVLEPAFEVLFLNVSVQD